LRTPLAGLDAQLALAQRECEPALHERLRLAREATSRLARVVAALLTLFRAGAQPHRQAVAVGALTTAMPFEGLSIAVDAAAALDADPDLLAAALFNLLENAVRHGAARVELGVRREGGWQVLRIADNGRGIPEDRRVAMAQALERQTYDHGVGLGLTLADRVARAHGGALRVLPGTSGAVLELWLHPERPGAGFSL
jgi:two-component system OmpR family sensor kinase